MINKSTLQFLKNLKANNHKEWMDANRKTYLAAKEDFEQFTGNILAAITPLDPTFETLRPKDCTFRINRDIRFSQNKAPYKSNMSWYISKGGKKSPYAGYYCHIEPGQSFLGGGIWMPEPNVLKNIRQEIDYNFNDFQQILQNKDFVKSFKNLDISDENSLTRPPKGYDADNPAIEFIKLKGFVVRTPIKDAQVTDAGFVQQIGELCSHMKPLIDFLNVAVDAGG